MKYEVYPIKEAYRIYENLPQGLDIFFKYCVWATPWPGGIIRIAALFKNEKEANEYVKLVTLHGAPKPR